MPLRALRLFPMLEQNFATSSSFAFTLQIAAGRAWSRRAMAHAQPARGTTYGKKLSKPSKPEYSIPTADPSRTADATSLSVPSCSADAGNPTFAPNEKLARLRDKQKQCYIPMASIDPERVDYDDTYITGTYTYFDPVLNNYEPSPTDLFSEEAPGTDCLKNISKDLLTSVATEPFSLGFPPLPIPTSARSLYHNLIHILRTRKPPPTLPALLDYHILFPKHHSTKSYNLMIFLSIHHRSFGITQSLFGAMQRHSIQNNIETYQLHVRWFIYQGFWDRAWSYVMQLMNKFPGGTIPFPIWLEFCHTHKGRTIIREDAFNATKRIVRKLDEPTSLFSARRKVMSTNRPLAIPALKDTPPAAMRNIVQLMMKAKLRHQALKLTEDYFRALPPELNSRVNHRCLEIVKVHLFFNGKGKTGLPRFNAVKRLLFSLLSSNPSLRPTSDTVFFVLSTLGKAKHCGTRAWSFVSLCKEKWGPGVEDRRVQRRVSKWALKEGRMDIVATILRAEALERRSRQRRLSELDVVGDVKRPRAKMLLRPPIRRIYPRNGREAQLWRHLRRRIHGKIVKHMGRDRKFTKAPRLSGRQCTPAMGR